MISDTCQPEFSGFPVSLQSVENPVARLLRITEEKGPLVPQNLLPSALGVSSTRVCQLFAAGRFQVVEIEGSKFVPVSDVQAWLAKPKDVGGRPKKAA